MGNEDFIEIVGTISYIKLSQTGHYVQGTLISVEEFVGDYGKSKRYRFLNDQSKGFNREGEDVILAKGEESSFLGHFTIDDKMKHVKLGQKFRVEFSGTVKSTKRKGAEYKTHIVKSGSMDTEWLKTQKEKESLPDDIFTEVNS